MYLKAVFASGEIYRKENIGEIFVELGKMLRPQLVFWMSG
jgi:hypothetical protein